MESRIDFLLFSDGGSNDRREAATATIVEDAITAERVRIGAYLGRATNNEAEILGGLIGLAFLMVLPDRHRMETCAVRWICDSEYALKSATGYIKSWQRNGWKTASKAPVKNQGLWRTFLLLSQSTKITPEHVRGHSGHPENEECDAAIQWVKERGSSLFNGGSAARTELIGGEQWFLFDFRELLQALREDTPDEEVMLSLPALLRKRGVDQFSGAAEGSAERTEAKRDPLMPILGRLREASDLAERLRGQVNGADTLADAIRGVLRQFGGTAH